MQKALEGINVEDIYKKIKEMEQSAKESQIWKDRYEELKAEVETVTKRLIEMTQIKISTGRRKSPGTGNMKNLAEELYIQMKAHDKEYDTDSLAKAMIDKGFSIDASAISKLRGMLKSMAGIDFRQDNGRKVIFYAKAMDHTIKPDPEVKFGKVSIMG